MDIYLHEVSRLQDAIKEAERQYEQAVFVEGELKETLAELHSQENSAITQSQLVLQTISEKSAEQSFAVPRCKKAKERGEQLKGELKQAEESLTWSHHTYGEVEKESQEVLMRIDRINNDVAERSPRSEDAKSITPRQ